MPLPKKIPRELVSKSSCAGKVYVNRYKVVKRLGNGSFGTVYLVEDLRANGERSVRVCYYILAYLTLFMRLCRFNLMSIQVNCIETL